MNFLWKNLLLWLLVAFGGVVMGQTLTAKDYFLLGSAKYKCRACDLAVKEFDKAIALDKNYTEAYYGRSLAYACKRNFAAAMIDIEYAIRLKPKEVLYQEGKARIKLESGKNLEAKAGFQQALRMDTLCWQAWYGLAMAERNLDSLRNSAFAFDKVIVINPEFAMSYLGRAEAHFNTGDYATALVDLLIAGDLAPNYAPIYVLRSSAQLRLENYEAAIEDATKATELDPSSSSALFSRGEAYFKLEQFSKAEVDYAAAIAINKGDGQSWYKRAACNERLGDSKTAKKYYGKAISKNRGLADAYAKRAAIWEQQLKPKKALPDLKNAIALKPDDVGLRLRRGFIYLQLTQIQLASDDFVHASRLDPTSGRAFYGLGMARYQNGNVNGACESWKQAAELKDPNAIDELSKYCNE
jgi:tetratricopeptide (TPR) repeat protein